MLVRLSLITIILAFFTGQFSTNTTWNGSLLGGGWVCFQAQITGCSQGFNATCNGVASDQTAWDSMLTYAASVSDAKVYIPPGASCMIGTGGSFNNTTVIKGATIHVDGTKVPKLTIWAYGASLNQLYLGCVGALFPDNTHNALLNTVSAGSSTVTLKNIGDASIFAVGKWIVVSGLSMQTFGYPPNWNTFEFKQITNIAGAVLTLDTPLSYSYKSTWPQLGTGDASNINLGGPAMAYVLNVAWDQELTIYGLRYKDLTTPLYGSARIINLYNISMDNDNGPAPSVAKTYAVYNSEIKSPEFDKVLDTLILKNVTGDQFIFQSSALNRATMDGVSAAYFNGTPPNWTANKLKVSSIFRAGPTSYGHGTSIVISNSTIVAPSGSNRCMAAIAGSNPAGLSFSSGRFTKVKATAPAYNDQIFAWAIPGQKYYFAWSDGTIAVPSTTFTITDLSEDATNIYIDTDIVGALPAPTCGGSAASCTCYTAWQASSVVQTNTGPGDLTPFAAPP